MVSTFIDFQFQSVVDETFKAKDAKTAFFGGFFAWLNGAAFIIQVFLTHRVLKKIGVGATLLLLPIGLTLGLSGFLIVPVLLFAGFNKFYDGSLNYSIHSAGREILYLPIDRTIRHKIKPFIDMFIYRFSKGMGGLLILVLTAVLGMSLRGITLFVLLIAALLILIILLIKREYVEALKRVILRKVEDPAFGEGKDEAEQVEVFDSLGDKELDKIYQGLKYERKEAHKRFLDMTQLALEKPDAESALDAKFFIKALYEREFARPKTAGVSPKQKEKEMLIDSLVETIIQREISLEKEGQEEERYPDEWYLRLRDCLENREVSDAVRKKAIDALASLRTHAAALILIETLEEPQESLRYEIIRALNKMRRKDPLIKMEALEAQLSQEADRFFELEDIASVMRGHLEIKKEAPFSGLFENALRSIRHESLERIFRLLSLYYPPELIELIHDRFRDGDDFIRANVTELLDNLLDPKLEKVLFPVLEKGTVKAPSKSSAQAGHSLKDEVFGKVLKGPDVWGKLLVIFMVAHCKLKSFNTVLTELSTSEEPVIREASRLALERSKGKKEDQRR
jgi:hypothetical protein